MDGRRSASGYVREVVIACDDPAVSRDFYREIFDFDIITTDRHETLGDSAWRGGRLCLVPVTGLVDGLTTPAGLFDLGPRLIGVYSRNLEETAMRIRRAGGMTREPVTYPYKGAFLSELVAAGIDDVWITAPLAQGYAHRPSPRLAARPGSLHSELHSVVFVVEDHGRALRFLRALGWYPLFSEEMRGADFEKLLGMPRGASLHLSFLVGEGEMPARIELMSFSGVPQQDRRFSRRGIQELVLDVRNPDQLRDAARRVGACVMSDGSVRMDEGITVRLADPDVG